MIETAVISPGISNEFDAFEKRRDRFQNIREEAFHSFSKKGFPTIRNEEWKYTNIKNIASLPLEFSVATVKSSLTRESIQQFMIAGTDAIVLVFENGKFIPELSDNGTGHGNATITFLSGSEGNKITEAHLGKVADHLSEPLIALNTAFMNDGLFIHIPKGVSLEKTVHFMHISSSEKPSQVSTVRNLVIAEKGSSLNVIETYHSISNKNTGFTNVVNEIVVAEAAHVTWVKAQLESEQVNQINFTQVIQDRNSTFDTVTVTLSGLMVRNNLHIRLNGVNCTSHLFGLYILDEQQHIDNHTLVDHAMPNCESNELYKGLIGGKGHAVFNGKIFVRKDAQKTNAYQSNKNILLSDDAQVNAKPQLEIFADDVKCTHGATTGQMDEEALFYLRSRGIGENNARTMLHVAFVADVLANIKNEVLRENLLNLAIEKLHVNEL